MNLVALKTLLAIIETGSLIKAAEQLNVTQSTVTARLQSLESSLGQKLVQRNKTGASLTASGIKLKRYAEVILELWRQAQAEAGLPPGMAGIYHMGCLPDLWPQYGQVLVDLVRLHTKQTALNSWPGLHQDLQNWLETGVVDIAISTSPFSLGQGFATDHFEDDLVLVGDRPDRPVRFDQGYIYVDHGVDFARDHISEFSDADVARMSFGSGLWAKDYLLANGGSCYLPTGLIGEELKNNQLFLIQDAPQFTRQMYLAWHQTQPSSETLTSLSQRFLEQIATSQDSGAALDADE
jgi:DNA-binding transcriptional LysR family regulator